MKISIITVCYNAGETIEETFSSIFNQTHKNTELIVIDGGSVDATLGVIEKYREKISHLVSEPDDGIYHAMNKGIGLATGDFLVFLNANDSFYEPSVLEKVASVLDKNGDAKILFGDANYISEDKKTSYEVKFAKITNDFALLANNICHQSIFYHKSLFKDVGLYSEDYKIYADWDFNIKCLVKNKVSALHLPLVISSFQLGGACSNSSSIAIVSCKNEKKLLIERYYSKYKPLIKTDLFLKNFFKSLYFPLKRLLICPFVRLYTTQKKYLLNVKTEEINN